MTSSQHKSHSLSITSLHTPLFPLIVSSLVAGSTSAPDPRRQPEAGIQQVHTTWLSHGKITELDGMNSFVLVTRIT